MSNPKKLYRIPYTGIIAGVCSGLAEYFDIDVTLIRIIWLVLFFSAGIGFIPYIIMWLIMPPKYF